MDEPKTKSKKPFKRWLLIAAVVLVGGYALYYTLIRTTNETGWVGADKYGRQVFIQTLSDFTDSEGVTVESDFRDHSVFERLVVAEPMRTALKYQVQKDGTGDVEALKKHLSQPYESFTNHYTGKITLRENYSVTEKELEDNLKKGGAKSIGDFYAALGFKRVEMYTNGKLTAAVKLTGTKNDSDHGAF